MFVKVSILPDGPHKPDNEVLALILMGPGCMIVGTNEKGLRGDYTKLVFPDGRAVHLAHSLEYMNAMIMGELTRPGLVSDVDKQLGATGKQ